jgi:hypothetical protein
MLLSRSQLIELSPNLGKPVVDVLPEVSHIMLDTVETSRSLQTQSINSRPVRVDLDGKIGNVGIARSGQMAGGRGVCCYLSDAYLQRGNPRPDLGWFGHASQRTGARRPPPRVSPGPGWSGR